MAEGTGTTGAPSASGPPERDLQMEKGDLELQLQISVQQEKLAHAKSSAAATLQVRRKSPPATVVVTV